MAATCSALLIGSGRHWLLIEDDLDEELADRLWRLLGSPARVVEDVLAEVGVTDLSGYAAVPGTPDGELFPDIFLD